MIPAILAVTVMVAGVFAFMPVEQASTVHTSTAFTENSMKYVTVSDSCTITGAGQCDLVTVNVATGDVYQLVSMTASMGTDVVAQTKTLDYAACVIGPIDAASGIDLPQFTSATATAEAEHDFVVADTGDTVGVGTAETDEINCPTQTTTAAQTAGDVTVSFTFIMNGDATDPVVAISQ